VNAGQCFYHQPNAGAGGHTFKHAGKNTYLIRFATLSGIARGAWTATVQVVLQIGFGKRDTRRYTVYDTSQRHTVRFTKCGDAENLPNTVSCHRGSLPLIIIFVGPAKAGPKNA